MYNPAMTNRPDLAGVVNASGFMLQLALEHAVEESANIHKFEIEAREHPWKLGDELGFIDLVVGRNTVRVVCECKRSRGGNWVFPVERDASPVDRARLLWTRFAPQRLYGGWFDFDLTSSLPAAQFCMVRGTGESDTSLLERVASRLIRSVEALADEETSLRLISDTRDRHRVYVPIVVTTSRLWLAAYEPDKIDLATGDVENVEFSETPAVLFRKALTRPSDPEPGDADEMPYRAFRRVSREQERTVIVVRSDAFVELLKEWRDGVTRPDTPLPTDWQ
jgi:hypothetical protein